MKTESVCTPHLKFDHLAVAARTLDEGAAYVQAALSIEMPQGGAHPRMGTHNRLLSLGDTEFLEVIAIDPKAPRPNRPRWFDLDRFDGDPRLVTWIVGTPDIEASLRSAHPACGQATEITRGDLTWLISISKDGSLPMEGAYPSLIQWPQIPHPAARMERRGCALQALHIQHPAADEIAERLSATFTDPRVEFQPGAYRLEALFNTPSGIRRLS